MIRIRIDRSLEDDWDRNSFREGIVWYEDGKPVGRVVIEQEVVSDVKDHPHYGQITSYRWAPVEVE